MISTTELKIFKHLEDESMVSDVAVDAGLDVSTVSKYVSSSIERGNGLFDRREEGKSVYIKRADTSHSNLLKTILNEYPHWNIETLFSHSRLKVAGMIEEPKRIKDIVFLTGLSRQYVRRCLKQMAEVGMVIKDENRYELNLDLKVVADFIDDYYSYVNGRKAKELCTDSVVLWQRGDEFLFKTSDELDDLEKTAVSRFYEYDLPIITDKNYYFMSEHRVDVKDVMIHTILIDKNSVTYNSYACLLYLKEDLEDVADRARLYDIEDHFGHLKEFVEEKKDGRGFLPTWEEFVDMTEEYEVSV